MFWCATWLTARDRREADATFLAQCADAGFDAAKCRFFLTATDGGRSHNTAATMQIIQSATH